MTPLHAADDDNEAGRVTKELETEDNLREEYDEEEDDQELIFDVGYDYRSQNGPMKTSWISLST